MASIERDVRLLLLAASAGSADGWAFLGLGHTFVANMTGNTILLGIAVFQNHGDLLHPAISLAAYLTGVLIGSLLTGNVRQGIWSKAISWTLMLEALLLLAAEAGWMAVQLHANHPPNLELLLATLSLAVGMQSAAMIRLNVPGIVTTYITGTWTTLVSGLVNLIRRPAQQQDQQLEERLMTQVGVVSVYLLSAVLAGWLFRYRPIAMGALPACSLLVVAVHGLIYND
jgi:uncharacterized membrane protein YoaK (UPF0700 family)